jgi:hypothetical protein
VRHDFSMLLTRDVRTCTYTYAFTHIHVHAHTLTHVRTHLESCQCQAYYRTTSSLDRVWGLIDYSLFCATGETCQPRSKLKAYNIANSISHTTSLLISELLTALSCSKHSHNYIIIESGFSHIHVANSSNYARENSL